VMDCWPPFSGPRLFITVASSTEQDVRGRESSLAQWDRR
jgi:hypothetical protein